MLNECFCTEEISGLLTHEILQKQLQQSRIAIGHQTTGRITAAELSRAGLTGTWTLDPGSTMLRSWAVSWSGSGAARTVWIAGIGPTDVQNLVVGAQNAGVGGDIRHWHGFDLPIQRVSARKKANQWWFSWHSMAKSCILLKVQQWKFLKFIYFSLKIWRAPKKTARSNFEFCKQTENSTLCWVIVIFVWSPIS